MPDRTKAAHVMFLIWMKSVTSLQADVHKLRVEHKSCFKDPTQLWMSVYSHHTGCIYVWEREMVFHSCSSPCCLYCFALIFLSQESLVLSSNLCNSYLSQSWLQNLFGFLHSLLFLHYFHSNPFCHLKWVPLSEIILILSSDLFCSRLAFLSSSDLLLATSSPPGCLVIDGCCDVQSALNFRHLIPTRLSSLEFSFNTLFTSRELGKCGR